MANTHLTQTGAEVQALLNKLERQTVTSHDTAYWQSHSDYVPASGEVVIYTDYKGGGIKVGTGSAYVGDLPFIGAGDVPSIFIAKNGVTTEAEIGAALTAGKTLLATYNYLCYTYCGLIFGNHGGQTFCRVDTSTGGYASIYFVYCSGSEWGTYSFELEATGHKVTTLSDQSTDSQYPSAKAVYDQLVEKYVKPSNGIPASDLASGVIPDVSSFITKSVDDLVNYYLKSETYTKAEVQTLIGAIQQFHYETYASTASVTNPQGNVLYLIGPTGTGEDKYEEYVYDVTKQNPWVKIGDTSIDLSGFVTTSDLDTALSAYTTSADLSDLLDAKQDVIDDLDDIRDGAAAGATAYQKPQTGIPASDLASGVIPDVSDFITKNVNDLTYYYTKTEIDGKVSSAYKAAGTVASVASLGTLDASHEGFVYNMSASFTTTSDFVEGSGTTYPAGTNVAIVNTGTASSPVYKYDVLAGFVDISGKADKSEMSVVDGTDANADKTTITLKSGTSATVLKSHQNISGKADKVSNATNGHLAALDGNGNLSDSGKSASDFQPTIDATHKLSYNLLSDTPTIPAAQVQTDWNASSGMGVLLNKPTLATVATSGSYNDLSNKPTIPTVVSMAAADIATAVDTAWNAVMS